MMKLLQALKRDERGVSAIEYAILAGIIVVTVAVAVMGFGEQISSLFENASTELKNVVDESTTGAGGS